MPRKKYTQELFWNSNNACVAINVSAVKAGL